MQPGLGRDVLRSLVAAHREVAQQWRMEGAPHLGEPGLVTAPSPLHGLLQGPVRVPVRVPIQVPITSGAGGRPPVRSPVESDWWAAC